MHSATFDTLAYVKKLRAVGIPEEQAEAQAEAIYELIDEKLATKRDLEELESRLEHKIVVKLGGLIVIITAVLAVLIQLG